MPSGSRDVRQDITDVLVRYATGIDRRDWALFRTCFTDDCEADYGEIGVWHGTDEITAFMEQSHADIGPSLHRITNVAITVHGDRAVARSYVDAVLLWPDQRGVRAVGYYDDELVQDGEVWRIARRTFTQILVQRSADMTASI